LAIPATPHWSASSSACATPWWSYNNKVLEFAQINTEVAFGFAQKLSDVKSPSDFIELSTEHSRKQFETLTAQTKELAALAQKVTLATAEPLRTGLTKAFG